MWGSRKENEVAISIFPSLRRSLCWAHKSTRLHVDNNQGDHMLLLRAEIYGFFPFFGEKKWRKTVESFIRFFCACHEENLHLHLRFPPFSPTLSLASFAFCAHRWKIKIFFHFIFCYSPRSCFSFRHLREWKNFFFMKYCVHSNLI